MVAEMDAYKHILLQMNFKIIVSEKQNKVSETRHSITSFIEIRYSPH